MTDPEKSVDTGTLSEERLAGLFDDAAPAVPAFEINPWRRPILLILWGTLLTSVTLNFFDLDVILPVLGMVLTYLGFRSLRRENVWFRAAWAVSVLRLILTALSLVVNALPQLAWEPGAISLAAVGIAQMAQIFTLREGLAEVFDRAGAQRRLGPVDMLIACNFLLLAAALAGAGEMGVGGILVLAVYAGVVISLSLMPARLSDTGYALRNAPVRLGDWQTALILSAALLILTVGAWFCGVAASVPEGEDFVPYEDPALSDRIPPEVLELLSPEDAAKLTDIREIDYKWGDWKPFPDGTDTRYCTVSVELEGYRLVVIHYFEYLTGAPVCGDGFSCWQSYGLDRIDSPTGRVAYELDGREYVSPLARVRGGARRTTSLMGSGVNDRVYGDIYVPLGAEHVRGYVMFTLMHSQHPNLTMNYNLDIDLLHTGFMATYRRGRPSEMMLSGAYDMDWRAQHVTMFQSFHYGEAE